MTVMENSIAWTDVASLCVEALSRASLRFDVCSEVGTPTSDYSKVLDEARSDGDSCSSAYNQAEFQNLLFSEQQIMLSLLLRFRRRDPHVKSSPVPARRAALSLVNCAAAACRNCPRQLWACRPLLGRGMNSVLFSSCSSA